VNYVYRETAVNTTVSLRDRVIGVTATGTSIYLPPISSVRAGFLITIKDTGAFATISPTIVWPDGSETIDGQNPIVVFTTDYTSLTLMSNGAQWSIL